MSTSVNFKVQKIQFALFPKNFNPIDKVKIANDLKVKTGVLFDGEPTILPLPIDAPLEIPRIMLQSKDGIFRCDVAIPRIDFFQQVSEKQKFEEVKNIYLSKVKQIYSYFIEDQALFIGRIGFIVDFITDLDESSNTILQNQLLKKDCYFAESRKIKNISLVFTEKDNIDTWEINRFIKIDSLRKISDPVDDKRLVLRYDINTISEKINEYNLTVEDIKKILDKASGEMTYDNINKFLNNYEQK
ncbi:hypothetical protein KAS79_01005 [Candidatus Parcubacteria bacterium]|nr:hypothetical protein [Candidatus Parcubacteria bacterium]